MKRITKKYRCIYPVLIFLVCILMVYAVGCTTKQPSGNRIDDWKEETISIYEDNVKTGQSQSNTVTTESSAPIVVQPTKPEVNVEIPPTQIENIGFS